MTQFLENEPERTTAEDHSAPGADPLRHRAAYFKYTSLTLVLATAVLSLAFAAAGQSMQAAAAGAFAVVGFAAWRLGRARRVRYAFLVSAYGIWLITLSVSVAMNGVRGPLWTGTAVAIMFAGMFAGKRSVIALTAVTLLTLFLLAHADLAGWPFPVHLDSKPYYYAAIQSIVIVLAGLLGYYAGASQRTQLYLLRLSQEKFFKAFRASPDFIVISTLDEGRYIDVNEAFQRLTGYSRDEAIGRTSVELGLWADPDERRRLADLMRKHGRVLNFESRFRRKSGEILCFESSNETIEIGGKQCVLAIAQDVTQRKAAADALRESEQRFRDLVSMSSHWAWEQDAQFRYTFVSQDAFARARVSPTNTIGKTRWELPTEGINEERWTAHRAMLERHEPFADFTYQMRNDIGELRWVSINGRPMFSADGTFRGYRGTGQDITDKVAFDQRLKQTQKMEAIGRLAGGIAHDFNNILAAIRGGVQLARAELASNRPADSAHDQIEKSAARAVELVQQILAFSRGQDNIRTAQDLPTAVRGAVQVLRAALPSTIEIRTEFQPELPFVLTNTISIHQTITNLGMNAAHAMSNAGRIDIEIDDVDVGPVLAEQVPNLTPGQFVRLTVRDSGCGMDSATLARIFEPFYSTKGLGEGTGLGLSVVYGVVKEHGGAIGVTSVPDKGTEFRIYFPAVARTAPETSAPPKPTPSAARAGGERLLFVDDDVDLVFISQNLLQKMGYRVQVCRSGEDALALFARGPEAFDAVITDMTMPGMSGLDLAEKVLAIRPNLPVIVMSGHVRDADSERALALGLAGIHWKPNTVSDLAETLRDELNHAKN